MSKLWTTSELQFLQDNYRAKGGIFCAKELGRTPQGVINKASRLNLKYAYYDKTSEDYDNELLNKELDFIRLESYQGSKTPILHECVKEHQWKVRPGDVLAGAGCPECYNLIRSPIQIKSNSEYCNELNTLNPSIKVLEPYQGSKLPILHECLLGHQWRTAPNNILSGTGCPKCSNHGFDYDASTILYYISITSNEGETLYKLGITNKTVKTRFRDQTDKKIEVIWSKQYDTGHEAYEEEQRLFRLHKDNRISRPGFIRNGYSELFSENVMPEMLAYD